MSRSPTVSASFARIRQEARLLYDWLRDHHDDFAAELDRTRVRDRWKLAMKLIAQHNLLDGRGNPPSQDTAIRTWKQVRADVAAARAKRQGVSRPALASGELAPGVRATAQVEMTNAWASASVSPPPAGQASLSGTAPTEDQTDGESDAMRRLRASMQAGKVPMPKPL
jgi:hypothetical protein